MARWFTIALGVVGWAVVLRFPPSDRAAPEHASIAWTALFAAVVLTTRSLAFRPVKGSVLSLDSAYYVAAALCVGPGEAGRLTAFALTVDAAARWLRRRRAPRPLATARLDDLGYILYFGGMSGGVVTVSGSLFGAGSTAPGTAGPAGLALRVVGTGAVLLLTHYALQGVRLRLLGRRWSAYLREQALPGIAAESSLLPIGVVLVLLYDPGQPLGFLLLSLTYLLINFVFSRLSRTRKQLEQRVHELEILNGTARRLAATLQLEELVEVIARETCRAIPEAEAVALAHRRPGAAIGFVLEGVDPTSERFFRRPLGDGEGAAGWVIRHGAARRIDDLATADLAVGDTQGLRSWLGVPIFLYGGCEGMVAVQSTRAGAFRADHQRLLESLALQIAARKP